MGKVKLIETSNNVDLCFVFLSEGEKLFLSVGKLAVTTNCRCL